MMEVQKTRMEKQKAPMDVTKPKKEVSDNEKKDASDNEKKG